MLTDAPLPEAAREGQGGPRSGARCLRIGTAQDPSVLCTDTLPPSERAQPRGPCHGSSTHFEDGHLQSHRDPGASAIEAS